ELEVQETDFDGLSFKNFLQEIEDDYMNCGPQLRMAFDKFAEQYKAAKSQSIGRVTTFLYDHKYNLDPSARIKSGAMIRVQPESVKRRKSNVKQRDKENDFQEIPKRKVQRTNKPRHNLCKNVSNDTLN
ncbi:10825_t:CDS:1, partial [Gigaspora margarita]